MAIATRPVVARAQTGHWQHRLQISAVLADLAMVVLACGCAVLARFGSADVPLIGGFGSLTYTSVSLLLVLAWMGALQLNQCYRPELFGLGSEEYRRIARATFGVFGAAAIISLLLRLDIARGYLAIALPLGLVLLCLERAVLRRIVIRRRAAGDLRDRVLVMGSTKEVQRAAAAVARKPAAGYSTVAVACEDGPSRLSLEDGRSVPNLGYILDDVAQAVREVDTLIIAGQSTLSVEQVRSVGWQLEGTATRLALASSMTDVAGPRIHRRPVEGLPLVTVEEPSYRGAKFMVKRCLDIVLSGAALVLLSPIFLLIAIAIRADDGGPVLFRQTRVGVGGRPFRMTKFRSMVPEAEGLRAQLNSDDPDGVLFKVRADPRITRVGRVLRGYSLDELPQLFDVLRGPMSLVGPRPPLPDEVSRYEQHVHRRLNVKPGVTGPWQVGGRSNLSWTESVRKDLYYVENWSVVGDLAIMVRTVGAVLRRDGAH